MHIIYMDLEKGQFLVKTARKAVNVWVKAAVEYKPKDYPREFDQKRGVFTTLHTYPGRELRGCIGYPEPTLPLIKAVVSSAVSATRDPRFHSLKEKELDKIVVEVSVLTEPKLIKADDPSDYLKKIKLGRDGLIIEKGLHRGLLLPQVPVEWHWDVETFLVHLCMKASLAPKQWLEKGTKLYCFQSDVFAEESPNGPIKMVEANT